MDAIEAEEFQNCAYYGIKLAEEAEDWVVRDNMLGVSPSMVGGCPGCSERNG